MTRPQDTQELADIAARLYPRDLALQAEWVRAIRTVRATSQGWVLDRPITRERRND